MRATAVVAVLVIVAGCAEVSHSVEPPASTRAGAPRALPSALVGQWDVLGPAVGPKTSMRVGFRSLELLNECGVLHGGWAAFPGGAIAAGTYAGVPGCFMEGSGWTPAWMGRAERFEISGDERRLLDGAGAVVATLRPGEVPAARAQDFPAPILDDAARAELDADPPAPPHGLRSASAEELVGRWVLADRRTDRSSDVPFIEFRRDGRFAASDGCNGTEGRWVLSGSSLLLAGGLTGLVGCIESAQLAITGTVGFVGDRLAMTGRAGGHT
ncbi:MAG: hypothetical protein ACT4QG_14475 [Sporichthyaceae bacterium]